MATFFSGSTGQRGVGSDMSFHHYPPPNPYPASSTGGLIPLPATVASHGHIAPGDAGDEPAFMNTMERPTSSDLLMANCQANSSAVQHQGLSLSLGTQVPVSLYQYRPASMDAALLGAHHPTTVNRNVQGGTSVQNTKYLKAARELLDELVSVRNAEKRKAEKSQSHGTSECKDGDKSDDRASNRLDSTGNSSAELSPSERQDLQNKVTALLTMLDQVERRYRHYHQQMQLVVSSFDAVAGPGAGKPYTTLALRTISRHFRSLRDAIGGQVQATRRSLGEQDASAHGAGIARLRYIDQHMRQQRAMQQFGMVQPPQHAWRAQRGLPESSVSILRAWLFEHFLHPYPKDSEKLMLARQTGLSRGQVSNWFINARVRLWKPMIEDMYKEEFGTEMDSNSSSENAGKEKDEALSSEDPEELKSPSSGIRHGMSQLGSFKSEAIAGLDTAVDSSSLEGSMNAYATSLSLNHHGPNASSNSSLLQDALVHHNGNLRFMAYNNMAGLGGYDGSSVSLTLGLQHCNSAGPVQTEQQGMLYGDAGDFEYMNSSEDRQRFGSSSSQLLHDFVT